MFELQINNDEIESIFELLGEKEDDLTFSLAWMMKQNKHLFSKIIRKAIGKFKFENVIIVDLSPADNDFSLPAQPEMTAIF